MSFIYPRMGTHLAVRTQRGLLAMTERGAEVPSAYPIEVLGMLTKRGNAPREVCLPSGGSPRRLETFTQLRVLGKGMSTKRRNARA